MHSNKIFAFLSSTINELHNERIAIKRSLATREIECFAFEFDIGSRPESAEESYLAELSEADIYVGVFWNQFSEPTAKECLMAKELNKPMFIYIKNFGVDRNKKLDDFLNNISVPNSGITYSTFNNAFELSNNVERDINRWLIRQWKAKQEPPYNYNQLFKLRLDAVSIFEFAERNQFIKILETKGNPPTHYLLDYRIKSISKLNSDGTIQFRDNQIVNISIDNNYPMNPPPVKIQTPIFHPNVYNSGTVCLGYHTLPYSLEDIVIRIARLINFDEFNTSSPSNQEASKWVSENESNLPIDKDLILQSDLPRHI